VSCDTYFYNLAHDAGVERLADWASILGFGAPTGIELAGESGGLLPSDEWSRRARGHQWYAGETISVGIGQGPILATPLQLAVAYSALLNGGAIVEPHFVAGRGKEPRQTRLDPQALKIVRDGLVQVVAGGEGTARRLAALPFAMAGKTGTSQVVRKKEGVKWQELPWEQRHHALFVGFAPPAEPTLVVVVVVEHGGDAASVAAPIAARILGRAFGHDVEMVTPELMTASPYYVPQPPDEPGPQVALQMREASDQAP